MRKLGVLFALAAALMLTGGAQAADQSVGISGMQGELHMPLPNAFSNGALIEVGPGGSDTGYAWGTFSDTSGFSTVGFTTAIPDLTGYGWTTSLTMNGMSGYGGGSEGSTVHKRFSSATGDFYIFEDVASIDLNDANWKDNYAVKGVLSFGAMTDFTYKDRGVDPGDGWVHTHYDGVNNISTPSAANIVFEGELSSLGAVGLKGLFNFNSNGSSDGGKYLGDTRTGGVYPEPDAAQDPFQLAMAKAVTPERGSILAAGVPDSNSFGEVSMIGMPSTTPQVKAFQVLGAGGAAAVGMGPDDLLYLSGASWGSTRIERFQRDEASATGWSKVDNYLLKADLDFKPLGCDVQRNPGVLRGWDGRPGPLVRHRHGVRRCGLRRRRRAQYRRCQLHDRDQCP